jgi:hypothetical protein
MFKFNSNRILKLFNLINVKKQISFNHPMSTLSNKKQFKVFVTQPIPSEALQILQENNLDVTINTKTPLDRETLLKSVQNIDALFCTLNEKINVELLDEAGQQLQVKAIIFFYFFCYFVLINNKGCCYMFCRCGSY